MKTTRFTDEQIIAFLKQAEAGISHRHRQALVAE
jgi:hypothetical protein